MPNYSEQNSPPTLVYETFLNEGSFRLQSCDACGHQIYFPRTICDACGLSRLSWKPVVGIGTVYSSTTVRRKADRGGDYNISIVELQEGARMMSRVEGIDPSEVKIGMRVSASIITEKDKPLVVFHPSEGDRA